MDKYSMCRPGGFIITDRAVEFCNLNKNSKIADVGCGSGATVYYIAENYGCDIQGVDKDEESLNKAMSFGGNMFFLCDAAHLPFEDNSLHALFFECSLTKMNDPLSVLKECSRVLKPNGFLIISDFYARGKTAKLSGLLGRMDKKENILKQIEKHGFNIKLKEDYSQCLIEMWGQMIFEQGICSIYENIGADKITLKEINSGYFLAIAQKENTNDITGSKLGC